MRAITLEQGIGRTRLAGGGMAACVPVLAALLGSGLLVALSEPAQSSFAWLRFVAFAPWLAILPRLNRIPAMVSGLAMGLAYIAPARWSTFATAISNTGLNDSTLQLVTLAFFCCYALPFAIFAGLDRSLHQYAGRTMPGGLALLRAGTLSSLISLCWTPFPYTPATPLADMIGIAQWASMGGEPLLLWLLLWPNAAVATLVSDRLPWQASLRTLLWPLMGLLLADAAGRWRVHSMDKAEAAGDGLRLSSVAVQLDLPSNPAPVLLTRDQRGGSMSAIELTRQAYAESPQCELSVWPETPLEPRHAARVCAAGQKLVADTGRPLLMQCHRPTGDQFELTAAWWAVDGAPATHAKSSLVPGYEQPWFGAGKAKTGTPGAVFALDSERRVIPALCYELYSNAHLRESVLAGGQFIAFMASFNAFAGQPIEHWNEPMAQLRAIAFGVPILRASNRANGGWIDANGRIRAKNARGASNAHCHALWSPAGRPTLFTGLAPIAAWLPALLALGWMAAGRLLHRRNLSFASRARRIRPSHEYWSES